MRKIALTCKWRSPDLRTFKGKLTANTLVWRHRVREPLLLLSKCAKTRKKECVSKRFFRRKGKKC
jgi:hypothetical protein